MQGDKLRGRKGEEPLSAAEASAFKNRTLQKGGYYDPPLVCVVRCALSFT